MLLGTLRYLLAHMIFLIHIYPRVVWWGAIYSLFGFYIMSGFLMTFILNERYGFDSGGLKKFYLNRALRIYPVYWVSLIISIAIILSFPYAASSFEPGHDVNITVFEWFANIFIVGLTNPFAGTIDFNLPVNSLFIQPAWALHVEIIFYILIPFLSRTSKRTYIWLSISIIYTAYTLATQKPWEMRYFTLLAASLPFSIGSSFYYFLKKTKVGLNFTFKLIPFLIICALLILNLKFASKLGHPANAGFYINLTLLSLIILFLIKLPIDKISPKIIKIDKFLGGISYPVYLLHKTGAIFGIAVLWNSIAPGYRNKQSILLFLFALPIVNLTSILIYVLFEKRIDKIRDKIRGVQLK